MREVQTVKPSGFCTPARGAPGGAGPAEEGPGETGRAARGVRRLRHYARSDEAAAEAQHQRRARHRGRPPPEPLEHACAPRS